MPAPITLQATVVAARRQVSTELGDEVVILGIDRAQYFGVDGVGMTAWSMLDRPRPVEEIRDAILAEYDVDEETCSKDLLAFLNQLHAQGLIEIVAS